MTVVAIVDDHALLADAMRAAMADVGIDSVRLDPGPAPSLLEQLRHARPSVVLVSLDVPAAAALIAPIVAGDWRVLVLTASSRPTEIAAALEDGALGYHPKGDGLVRLLDRIEQVAATRSALDVEHRLQLLEVLRRERAARHAALAPFDRLTEREQKTLLALARGRSVHDIARDWVVSAATVRTHVRGVLTKLGVPSQLAAVAAAIHAGWLQPDTQRRGYWLPNDDPLRVPAA